ncbi:MAG: ABC transporter ATP-binding protein [Pseudomonadota bacterium]
MFEVRDLTLSLDNAPILNGVSFSAAPGRITTLVGESGSGKSMTLRACLGLAPARARIAGAALLDGEDVLRKGETELERLRGARIGMVFQEALTALNPVRTIGAQIAEVLRAHRRVGASEARTAARAALDRVGLAAIEARRYPHQLSGGQRQRVAIAMATLLKPAVLLADEPTTALDVTTQAKVLDLLQSYVCDEGLALVLVTHDLALVSAYADDVAIMHEGRVVEHGQAKALGALRHPYSLHLLAAASAYPRAPAVAADEVLLDVKGVSARYEGGKGRAALEDVSFTLRRGETLAVAGESGAGKSTLARIVLGLQRPSAGAIRIAGETWAEARGAEARRLRRQVQIVFQDPASSFDPRQRVETIIAEPLHLLGRLRRAERRARVETALGEVGLEPDAADRLPHQFSGGQRQRIAIARALITEPSVIVLDEALSALDASVRAEILTLLADIRQKRGAAYLLITHDLQLAREIADRILVLHNGRVVEEGDAAEMFATPKQAYTRTLLAATPKLAV